MSNWFDLLYGKRRVVDAISPDSNQASGQEPDVTALFGAAVNEPVKETLKTIDVIPAPPLPRMPPRWLLELQKSAFHLMRESAGSDGAPVVAFSGMQARGGVSTISDMISHYLAVDAPDKRVLYIDFAINEDSGKNNRTGNVLRIGQPLSGDVFCANPKAYAKFSARRGDVDAELNASQWFRDLIELSKEHFDWITVDLPPFYAAPESYTISQLCDGVVLVLKSGETRHPALNGLVADLEQVGIRVLGTILNFRQYPIPRWLLKYI